jgi:hypothetical protein
MATPRFHQEQAPHWSFMKEWYHWHQPSSWAWLSTIASRSLVGHIT